MHPDGDEMLYLISGAVTVTLELGDGNCLVDPGPGEALVVAPGSPRTRQMRGGRVDSCAYVSARPNRDGPL